MSPPPPPPVEIVVQVGAPVEPAEVNTCPTVPGEAEAPTSKELVNCKVEPKYEGPLTDNL